MGLSSLDGTVCKLFQDFVPRLAELYIVPFNQNKGNQAIDRALQQEDPQAAALFHK